MDSIYHVVIDNCVIRAVTVVLGIQNRDEVKRKQTPQYQHQQKQPMRR